VSAYNKMDNILFSQDGMEFSVPKRIGKSNLYTQTIWDKNNKTGYLAIVEKKGDTYYIHKTPNKSNS